MENIENDFPIKRFGKVAIDIIAFAALAVILVTIMSIPFSVLFLKTDKESPDSMFVFMLSETLMLIGVWGVRWQYAERIYYQECCWQSFFMQ